jgi:hypothetical protein
VGLYNQRLRAGGEGGAPVSMKRGQEKNLLSAASAANLMTAISWKYIGTGRSMMSSQPNANDNLAIQYHLWLATTCGSVCGDASKNALTCSIAYI